MRNPFVGIDEPYHHRIDLLVNQKLAQALMDRITEANIKHFGHTSYGRVQLTVQVLAANLLGVLVPRAGE